jgi:hypothetical protein
VIPTVFGLALLAQIAPAAPPPQLFPMTVDKLPNGLTVVTVPVHAGAASSFYTLVRAGSRDEIEPGKSGYAHLFEHLMFRGTEKVPARAYDEKMQALGSDNNAFTTDDFTFYIPLIPKESLSELIELEADRFQHLSYTPAQYKDETGAVLGEYNKDFSNPWWAIDEAIREVAFKKHTYGHTVIGYKRDVEAMPNAYDYSKQFFKRFYTPDDHGSGDEGVRRLARKARRDEDRARAGSKRSAPKRRRLEDAHDTAAHDRLEDPGGAVVDSRRGHLERHRRACVQRAEPALSTARRERTEAARARLGSGRCAASRSGALQSRRKAQAR